MTHAHEVAHDTEFYRLLLNEYDARDRLDRERGYVVQTAAYDTDRISKIREARSAEAAYEKFPVGTVYSLRQNYTYEYVVVSEPRTLSDGRVLHTHYAATARDALAVLPADHDRVVAWHAAVDALAAARDAVDAHDAAGYTGWTRYLLCTSSNGHVHRDSRCSTCRPSTRFAPVVSLSGADDAEAIEKLGETLCSVCYPDAPVTGKIGKLNKTAVKRLLAADNAAVTA